MKLHYILICLTMATVSAFGMSQNSFTNSKNNEEVVDSATWGRDSVWIYVFTIPSEPTQEEDHVDGHYTYDGGGSVKEHSVALFTNDTDITDKKWDLAPGGAVVAYYINGVKVTSGIIPAAPGYGLEKGTLSGKGQSSMGSDSEDKSSDVKITYYAGGPEVIGKQLLVAVNASASQQLSIPYFVTGGPVIPSEQIAIPGLRKNLGTDGWAYGEVANGTPVDVTPTAGAPMYDFDWPGAAAYALSIVASSSTTQADLSISTPEFCVGQQVTFGTVWNLDPDYMPPNMLNPTYAWAYSGTFVNHSSQANSHSSVNWDVDVSLMNVATPYAYWVSGGNKNAYVNETLHFDNGQSATVSANGQFDMYRPSVAMVNSAYHGASMNVWRTPWNSAYFGDIGLGQVGGPSNMSYLVRVTSSDFSGAAKITQLCSINATALVNVNITGELDNGDPYTGATANIYENSNPQGTINELQLDDAPSDGWVSSFHDYSSFSDYVMFKPNGDGIYVTLGMVNWGMSFGASYPSLSISPNLVTGPSNPNGSDTFPTWEEIYSNQ